MGYIKFVKKLRAYTNILVKKFLFIIFSYLYILVYYTIIVTSQVFSHLKKYFQMPLLNIKINYFVLKTASIQLDNFLNYSIWTIHAEDIMSLNMQVT